MIVGCPYQPLHKHTLIITVDWVLWMQSAYKKILSTARHHHPGSEMSS